MINLLQTHLILYNRLPFGTADSTLCPKNAVMEVERLGHAVQMRSSGEKNKNMKYLMRAPPDIEGTRKLALGPAHLQSQSASSSWF